jgi:hypothetical protein
MESVLRPLAESLAGGGAFFNRIPAASLDNVIENITTKESAAYTDVCANLQDLHPVEQSSEDNTTFAATASVKAEEENQVCMYCKSKGFRGLGREVRECRTKKRDGNLPQSAAAAVRTDNQSFAFATV